VLEPRSESAYELDFYCHLIVNQCFHTMHVSYAYDDVDRVGSVRIYSLIGGRSPAASDPLAERRGAVLTLALSRNSDASSMVMVSSAVCFSVDPTPIN